MNWTLILIPFFCVFLVNMSNIPHKLFLRFKPFNCAMCLTFWLTGIYAYNLHFNPWTVIFASGANAYLTGIIRKLI